MMISGEFNGQLNFSEYLENRGYYFGKEVIENYLLSLKVKPFIILTGNAGTGKTNLGYLFSKYIGYYSNEYYMIKVSTLKRSHEAGSKDKHVGWGIYREYLENILPIDKINGKYEVEIGGFTTKADLSLIIQLYYDFHNEKFKNYFKKLYYKEKLIKNEGKLSNKKHERQMVYLGVSLDSIKNLISDDYIVTDEITLYPTLTKSAVNGGEKLAPFDIFEYMPFKKSIPCNISANGIFSNAHIDVKLRMRNYSTDEIKEYLNKLYENHESHFELKINGFKHDFRDFKFSSSNLKIQRNYEVLPVGTDWNDGSHILGYFNVISNEYQSTSANDLIKKAQNDQNNPYFLILDEMNLAPVERYFADFLSAIETGESIPLYGNDDLLKLPKNLFIIGTVNFDENNHTFLPRVLDRANVIELDTVFASEYMHSDSHDDTFKNIAYLQSPLMDCDISLFDINDLREILSVVSYNGENLWSILSTEITKFQKILKDSKFEFGYRVINEILRFMVVAWRYENSPKEWNNWNRYFDAQIKQKILPKLQGSEKDIEIILINLFKLCLEDNDDIDMINFNILKSNCKFYTSALKLQKMYKILSEQGKVSFI